MALFRVLLVDDEEELVTTLAERLSYRGVEAVCAFNGQEALEMMQNTPFDVVVLDLKMPGLSGLEVMKRMRQTHPGTPVLMITGHGSLDTEDQDIPSGATGYLVKPIHLDDLIRKMREVIEGHE